MTGFGSVVAVTFTDEARAERFIAACPFIRPTTSFGGVHTSAERRARWGEDVPEGFVRLSLGTEPTDELVAGSKKRSAREAAPGKAFAAADQPLLVRSLRMSSSTPDTSVVSAEAWTPFRCRLASGSAGSSVHRAGDVGMSVDRSTAPSAG